MISVFSQQEIFEKHFPFQKILKKNEIIKFRRIIPKNFCEIGDFTEKKTKFGIKPIEIIKY